MGQERGGAFPWRAGVDPNDAFRAIIMRRTGGRSSARLFIRGEVLPFPRPNGPNRDALPPDLTDSLRAGEGEFHSPELCGGFMSRQFAFPLFGALAALLSCAAIPSSSHAAETCLAAPKGAAPQGSHWYYRLDRATQRKCWRLVKLDQQPQRVAKQTALQPEPAAEEATAPLAETSAGRVQSPQHGWLTRSASAAPETVAPTHGAFGAAGERATDQAAAPRPVFVAQEQASDAAAPVSPVQSTEPKQPNTAAKNPAAVPAGTGMAPFVFVAIAGIGLLVAAIFLVIGLRRRRTDVLTRVAHEDITSFEPPEADDAPTFSPLPPMRLLPQHDDVDEALQRSRRRRVAA
jgi:hypothetical protein